MALIFCFISRRWRRTSDRKLLALKRSRMARPPQTWNAGWKPRKIELEWKSGMQA